MKKPVLIIEKNTNPLMTNPSKKAEDKYILGGTFTEFNKKNRNERIYTWKKFSPALTELNERINTLGVYGEFDHPDNFDTSLKNASHIVTEAFYSEKDNRVKGKIKLVPYGYGKAARELVDGNFPLFVSSRAAGITESNGEVQIKKLFTYDIVADPGFSSAKVSSINESCGYSNDANFRIYEMTDESNINDLFTMNKNDLVTKNQMTEYSGHLTSEISKTRSLINKAIKEGKIDAKKLNELQSYYESLQENHSKIVEYLDYMAEKIQYLFTDNSEIKKTNEAIIKHNDYLAEKLEETINYTEYLAENLDQSIQYGEYLAEHVDKNISLGKKINERLENAISFSEYIAENLNHTIVYSEYIAENLDTTIAYGEYLAENLDKGLQYSEYLAETVDKHIDYTGKITEKLNSKTSKLFESIEGEEEVRFETPEEVGFDLIEVEADDEIAGETEETSPEQIVSDLEEEGENCRVVCDDDEVITDTEEEGSLEDTPDLEVEVETEEEFAYESKVSTITNKIDELINEAKKREASKTENHHFLAFLNRDQIKAFESLSPSDQEEVVSYINEKGNYYTAKDVMRLMNEALSTKEESLEDKLVRLMPDSVKEKWDSITEGAKVSILSQAKLHPNLKTEDQIEHFWFTRKFPVINETRQVVTEDKLINEDKLDEDYINRIAERFNNL